MKRKNNGIVKKNLSSTQVLKTLQVLLADNYKMTELIQKLNENEKEPIFNNSVVSKYINTCRFCGIKIPKINNMYYVSSMPFGMNITDKELELIQYLQECAREEISGRLNKKFGKFIEKLSRYSNKEISRLDGDIANITYSIFEKALTNKCKLKLMLKNKTSLTCVPINIVEYKGKQYFHIYVEDKERMVLIDSVAGIEILKERFIPINTNETIIFKLTGDLAKNYNLRENEKIVNTDLPESITVMNRCENKMLLLSRLLRYGNLCEIEKPRYIREEMAKIVEETLKNYGEV